jgi:hypothetical protein
LRDYYVILAENGTAAYSLERHEATLKTMDLYFGEVVPIAKIASYWGGVGAEGRIV